MRQIGSGCCNNQSGTKLLPVVIQKDCSISYPMQPMRFNVDTPTQGGRMMRVERLRRSVFVAFLVIVTVVMAACGGGGSSPTTNASISGAATFPTTADQVALGKRVASLPESVVVEIYGLDGKIVGTPLTITSAVGQQTYSYTVPNIPTGVNYVVKVKRGLQVLKKLIEKKDVGSAAAQNIDVVTTTAVVVVSQQLSTPTSKITLGELLPAGTSVSNIAAFIVVVKPALLESSIQAAKDGGRSTLTAESASMANILNMVVFAVSDRTVGSIDSVLDGTKSVSQVPIFDTAHPTVMPVFVNMSSHNTSNVISQTVYVPPTTDTGVASQYVAQANTYLSKQDIANADKYFDLALASDPNNPDANMGGAITHGVLMFDDPQFKAIAARWDVVYPSITQVVQGTSPIRLPFGNLSSLTIKLSGAAATASQPATPTTPGAPAKLVVALKALQGKMPQQKSGFKSLAKELGMVPANAPSISEMQTLIDNVIIPRINEIVARLAKIEGKTGNSYVITKTMQGNPYGADVILGDGEYYALDTVLNLLQVLFKISTSYNFDVPTGYSYDTIPQNPLAMINDPNVFTLKSGGSAKMTEALSFAKIAAAKGQLAFDALKNRVSGAGALDFSDLSAADKTNFQSILNDINAGLVGQTTIAVKGKQVAVNFTKFFTTPLDRSKLPTFGYDVPRDTALSAKYGRPVAAEHTSNYNTSVPENTTTDIPVSSYTWTIDCYVKPTSDLPDYSLNGILPGNTIDNNVAEFNGILPMLSGKLLSSWSNNLSPSTTDGTYIYGNNYNFSNSSNEIVKIDPATGVVTTLATHSGGGNNHLVWYNNGLYAVSYTYQYNSDNFSYDYFATLAPITISGGSYTVGTPVWTSALSSLNANLSGFTANGSDIYYGVSTYNQFTWTTTTEIRKLSNLSTSVSLFTISDWVGNISVSNGSIYVNGSKYSLTAPYALTASYANLSSESILVGGYFYKIDNGKIVKYAGTPAKGTAKTLSSLF
jgi:hypothetical protein